MKRPFENKIHVLRSLGLILSLGSLPLAFSMVGCASSDDRQVTREHHGERSIHHRVTEALENDSRHKQFADVRVETHEGVVTLTGYVSSKERKLRVAEVVRGVHGVTEVVNRIVVAQNAVKEPTPSTTEPDNTARNVRDRDNRTLTPFDQGNSKADLDTTAQIRKEILAEKDMSVDAKNVKIITNNGQVTLRGPVNTSKEKRLIGNIANRIARSENVDNQLEIRHSPTSNN